MNPKDVILAAMDLNIPDRIPVAFFGGGMWTIFNTNNTFQTFETDPEEYAAVMVKIAEKLRSDVVYPGSGYNNYPGAALGGEMKYPKNSAPELARPIVTSPEDLDLLELDKIDEYPVIDSIRKTTRMVAEKIGDTYLVATTQWGPFTLAGQFRGAERLLIDLYKQPDFARKVIEFALQAIKRFYKPLIEEGILECVSIADPTAAGDLVSPKHFKEFALPYLKNLTETYSKLGVKTILHICGDTSDRLEIMPESGADLFSLDHRVDLAFAVEKLKGKICMGGNLDPVTVLHDATPESVYDQAKKAIETAGKQYFEGGAYVLMPGCDIPATVPYENIKAFTQAAHDAPVESLK
jgi:uroporphyrinogen decarboxylase